MSAAHPSSTSATENPRSAASVTAVCTHPVVTTPVTTSVRISRLRRTYSMFVLLKTEPAVLLNTISSPAGFRSSRISASRDCGGAKWPRRLWDGPLSRPSPVMDWILACMTSSPAVRKAFCNRRMLGTIKSSRSL